MANIHQCTEARFLKDVAGHKMLVLKDDGVHRHVRFMTPDTSCNFFDLVTWPGILCVQGDCGCYVFSRVPDMFEFFRMDRHGPRDPGATLFITPSYWQEKVLSADRHGGVCEFSAEKFKEAVEQYIADDDDLDDEKRAALRQEVQERFLDDVSNAHEAYAAISEFEHDGFQFVDFSEYGDHEVYTYRFIWNCYAIAWGIAQYDAAKVAAAQPQEA